MQHIADHMLRGLKAGTHRYQLPPLSQRVWMFHSVMGLYNVLIVCSSNRPASSLKIIWKIIYASTYSDVKQSDVW